MPAARAETSGSAWGGQVTVPAGDTHEGDLLALGGGLAVDGEATGDAVAVSGDVVIRGRVEGDALALCGDVRVTGADARVGGNAFSLLGRVIVEDGATVDGQARAILAPRGDGRVGYFSVAWSKAGILLRVLCILFWTCAALVAAFAAPGAVVHAASEMRRHPVRLFGIGLLVHVSLLLTLVLFVALVAIFIGLPLLFLLMLAWAVLEAGGLAATFHAIGDRLTERAQGTVSGYAKLLLGALVLAVLCFIPVLGVLAWLAAMLVGSGALVATRLRR